MMKILSIIILSMILTFATPFNTASDQPVSVERPSQVVLYDKSLSFYVQY